jgi:hypothetical protein
MSLLINMDLKNIKTLNKNLAKANDFFNCYPPAKAGGNSSRRQFG